MYLQNDQMVATIGGATFRTFNGPSNPQFVFDPDGLNDFWESATTRRDDTVYPNGWGNFREPTRRGTVTFTISGTARADTPRELMDLRDLLMGICNDGAYKEFVVTTSSGIRRSRNVTLEGTPKWVQHHDTFALFQISFYSPEPYLYGDSKEIILGEGQQPGGLAFPLSFPLNFGGPVKAQVVTMENAGNTPAWPKFIITGNLDFGFKLDDNRGNQIVYNGMVTTQSPVTLDMAKGTAIQNNQDRSTLLGYREWFSIPAKGSIRPTFEVIQAGTGWATGYFRDTWT